MNIETLTTFFGWCTVINLVILLIASLKLIVLGEWASSVHARMFKIDGKTVRLAYFKFIAYYKLAIIVFSLVPFIALKIIATSAA